MKIALQCAVLVAVCTTMIVGHAGEPTVKTPSPVIYLADNLDEKDELGWCIDTIGRGFAERLHAHSCKPQGGDVQFSFSEKTGQIMSVAFADYCMANRPDSQSTFSLETCDADAAEQQFVFNASRQELSPASNSEQCVVVGSSSRSAGPFMSRGLDLAECSKTDASLKQWIVKS